MTRQARWFMYSFTPRRCRQSNKIMYKTREQAEHAAFEGEQARGTHLWTYQCQWCGTWHLTHTPPHPNFSVAGAGVARKPRSRKRGYKPKQK